MFDRVITLFNYKKDEGKWHGTVIKGCTVVMTDSVGNTARGRMNRGSVSISIRCKRDLRGVFLVALTDQSGVYMDDERTVFADESYVRMPFPNIDSCVYYEPMEYQGLSSVDGAFTFAPQTDFFVVDRVFEKLEYNEDDYESGFYEYINEKYDNAYKIDSCSYYRMLPHFVVGGR